MPSPLITIIIAVYNGSDTLERCLESIAKQSFREFELILMDGGSTDGTLSIIEAYSDQVTYWESAADRGIYHAWNKALAHAQGEWVLFLGADDRLHDEGALERMLPHLESKSQHPLVYGKLRMEGAPYDGLVLGKPWNWRTFRRRMSIPHTAAFHHRKLFEEVGPYNESFRISADYELLLRKKIKLNPIFVDEFVTVMAAGGTSVNNATRSLEEARRAQVLHQVNSAFVIQAWHHYFHLRIALQRLKRS